MSGNEIPRDHARLYLVNNAGSRPVEIDAPEEQWAEGMTLNFDRHRQLTHKLLPNFIARKAGAIISLSGNLEPEVVQRGDGREGRPCGLGCRGNSDSHGVTVNCVQPGFIDTAQIRRLCP